MPQFAKPELFKRLFPAEDFYRTTWPVLADSSVVKITTHYTGLLPMWKVIAELAVNIAIFMVTVWIASFWDAGFALLWLCLGALVPLSSRLYGNLAFKFSKRTQRRDVDAYEGADIPQELIDKYERAQQDLLDVMTEIQRLAGTGRG